MNHSKQQFLPLSVLFALAIVFSTVSDAYAAALPEKLTPLGIPAGIRSAPKNRSAVSVFRRENFFVFQLIRNCTPHLSDIIGL